MRLININKIMSKKRLQVNVDLDVLKSQLRKDDKFSQGIRLYAVYQVATGKLPKDLVSLYDVSIKSRFIAIIMVE